LAPGSADSILGHLALGELRDRARPGHLGQEPQGAGGEVVVGVLERAPPRVSYHEELGRTATAAAGGAPRAADLDHAAGQQAVEVAADRRGREAQPRAQRGRAHRPVLQDEAGYPGPGAAFAADLPMGACGHAAADGRTRGAGRLEDSVIHAHVFHNISVA
jgi:hypothetical protein